MLRTNYRYERKFFLDRVSVQQLELILQLHPANFKKVFPARQINNIYLDTSEFKYYYDNLAGAEDRLKVRVRWYGDLDQLHKPQLEVKARSAMLNKKLVQAIDEISLNPININFSSKLNDELLAMKCSNLQAVLLNNYQRQYFQDFTGRFRITIDSQLNFYPISSRKIVKFNQKIHVPGTILELKYAPELDIEADQITSFFPFRLSRNSKYVTGISRLYPNLRIC